MVIFKVLDFTYWITNNYFRHIAQYLKKQRLLDIDIWLVNRIYNRNIFLKKSYTKCGGEAIPRFLCKKSKLSIQFNQQSEVL